MKIIRQSRSERINHKFKIDHGRRIHAFFTIFTNSRRNDILFYASHVEFISRSFFVRFHAFTLKKTAHAITQNTQNYGPLLKTKIGEYGLTLHCRLWQGKFVPFSFYLAFQKIQHTSTLSCIHFDPFHYISHNNHLHLYSSCGCLIIFKLFSVQFSHSYQVVHDKRGTLSQYDKRLVVHDIVTDSFAVHHYVIILQIRVWPCSS